MLTKNYSPKHSAIASLRFDSSCFNCGMDNTLFLELDHYVARSKGGENKDFLLLCSRCNKAKSNLSALDFFGDAEVIDEIEARLQRQFSDDEILTEMSRLIANELQFVSKVKAKNQKLSTSAKRASEMKGVK